VQFSLENNSELFVGCVSNSHIHRATGISFSFQVCVLCVPVCVSKQGDQEGERDSEMTVS
jgi:hypothetical protein